MDTMVREGRAKNAETKPTHLVFYQVGRWGSTKHKSVDLSLGREIKGGADVTDVVLPLLREKTKAHEHDELFITGITRLPC